MNSPSKQWILLESKYSTSLVGLVEIIQTIQTIIRNNNLSLTITDYELTLIIDEAITNAMEHGNKWNPDQMIAISAWIDKKSLYISVEDEGDGFDFENYRSECERGNKLANRGRGLMIISHFCKPSWKKDGRVVELAISLENDPDDQKAV